MTSPQLASLEALFQEARRAHKYALPMPRAKARGHLTVDDTEFFLRPAPAEAREEQFPLRVVPPGGLHFPAPSREQHREDGAFWSCAWTLEGVVRALRAGAFFASGHHDFATREAGSLALAHGRAQLRSDIKGAETFDKALSFARECAARPSRLDPDELLKDLVDQPSYERTSE